MGTVKRNINLDKDKLGRARGGLHTDRPLMLSEFPELFNENLLTVVFENVVDITYPALKALRDGGTLTKGTVYSITDRTNYQGFGTGVPNPTFKGNDRGLIFITALENNILGKQGTRIMKVPKYYTAGTFSGNVWKGVWNSTLTVAIGNYAVWGGKVYQNLTGAVGTAPNSILLDYINWIEVAKTDAVFYEDKQFAVMYDFDTDWIEFQMDGASNKVGLPFGKFQMPTDFNPCDISDWNKDMHNNTAPLGIYNNGTTYLFHNICRGKITGNRGFMLSHNQCNSIIDNNITYLQYNYSFNIQGNNGTFLSYNKNVDGDIVLNNCNSMLHNSNFGYIYNNTCSSLNNNSNIGEIDGNTCVNLINNANIGPINANTVTQNIENNTSKVGSILSITGQYAFIKDVLHTTAALLGYELTITGLTTVDLTIPLAPYISKVLLKSTNPTETITDLTNFINDKIVRCSPDTGVIVTFNHNPAKIRCEGGINAVVDGATSDWVEFDKVSNFNAVRQYNIGTY